MNIKVVYFLLLCLVLAGCANNHPVQYSPSDITYPLAALKCPDDSHVVTPTVVVVTNFETKVQTVNLVWQCFGRMGFTSHNVQIGEVAPFQPQVY